MTMAQRKRAAELQKVMYAYSKYGRAWFVMFLIAILQTAIILGASIPCIANGNVYHVSPVTAMLTFMQFLACMIPAGIDNGINEKVTLESLHGSVMPAKFMSCLPFEARDLFNFKLCLWEKAAAVNVLFVTFGHVTALIAETNGYASNHGASGLFTFMAIIAEAIFIVPFLIKSTVVNVVLGSFIGFGASFAFGIMDGIPDLYADSFSPLKIFSGVSGILIYIAATVVIAVIGELYVKNRKDKSWGLFK